MTALIADHGAFCVSPPCICKDDHGEFSSHCTGTEDCKQLAADLAGQLKGYCEHGAETDVEAELLDKVAGGLSCSWTEGEGNTGVVISVDGLAGEGLEVERVRRVVPILEKVFSGFLVKPAGCSLNGMCR